MSEDEIGFGPSGEPRPPSRRLRWVGVAAGIGGAAAAAIAIAVTAAGAHHGAASPAPAAQSAAAVPIPQIRPLSAVCPPVEPTWPNLAALPAGLRPGALKMVVAAQFSGRCPAS